MNNHYYILPDGSFVDNMKDGKRQLGIGGDAFRSLVRKEIIKKVTYNQKLKSDGSGTTNKEVGFQEVR